MHRFAVIGSEAGLKSVIDTAAGGPSLAQATRLLEARLDAPRPRTALANAYLSPKSSRTLVEDRRGGSGGIDPAPVRRPAREPGSAVPVAIPSANAVALDLDTLPPTSSSPHAQAVELR